MPFQKGNKLSVGHKRNTDHNGEALERFLLFLVCGGAKRMQGILEQENDEDFREDFWKGLEYVAPKRVRKELTGKDGEDLFKNLPPQEEKERINHLLDELNAIAATHRIREGNGEAKPLLLGEAHIGIQPNGNRAA